MVEPRRQTTHRRQAVLVVAVLLATLHHAAPGSATTDESAPCTPGWVPRFTDVTDVHPFCIPIEAFAAIGLAGGYPDGTYRPASFQTRQTMAAFLHRLAGSPAIVPPDVPSFTDVPVDHQYFVPIEWLTAVGVVRGFDDGVFLPESPVTRQHMAAFLYRFFESPAFTPPEVPTFDDVGMASPFRVEIEWLASVGAARGYTDGSFGTQDRVSRQTSAAFFHRLDGILIWRGVPDGETVAILGDSISGMSWSGDDLTIGLADAGYRHALRAHGGHRWDQRLPASEVIGAADPPARQVVINLGTNDANQIGKGTWTFEQSLTAIDEVLATISHASCIHLVTVHTNTFNAGLNTWAAALNDHYNQLAASDPAVHILDWDALVAAHGVGAVTTDGVHPNEVGQALLRDLVLAGVASCALSPPEV